MDLCSQRTLGTSVSNILQVHRLQQALDEACRLRKQLLAESVIFQSDHQSQFNANSFRFEVVKRNFAQCMVGVGYCFYYIPTESFWSPVRTELHLHKLYDAFHWASSVIYRWGISSATIIVLIHESTTWRQLNSNANIKHDQLIDLTDKWIGGTLGSCIINSTYGINMQQVQAGITKQCKLQTES